jgi:hypothetical protein
MTRALVLLALLLNAGAALARNVIFVDNAGPAGNGTVERPFPTLLEAQRMSRENDILYVADGIAPYEGSVTLKRGQMLIGSAYGLDAAKVDFHAGFDGPSKPAVQGPGPTIHGGIYVTGDNVIAGCTITVETGIGIAAFSPQGPIDVRKVYIRPSKRGIGISIQNSDVKIGIDGGGLASAEGGSGIFIDGGLGDVTFDRFPIGGSFSTAVAIMRRTLGTVAFRNGSAVKIDDAVRDAVTIVNNKGSVLFELPLQLVTHGGRGLVLTACEKLTIGGASKIDSTNAAALEVHDSLLEATFDHLSATGVAPGRLNEGVVLDKLRGRFAVTGDGKAGSGGTIRNAQLYGIRIVQSSAVRIANVDVVDSGSAAAKCPEDIVKSTNVRCSAGVYLRHVAASKLENLRISGGSGVGLNTNNIDGVTFDALEIASSGATASDPALLMQESVGTVSLSRCTITDGGGGQIAIEQRFNGAAFSFDRCTVAAPQKPTAPALMSVRASLDGTVDIRMTNARFSDNAGAGISVESRDRSKISIAVEDSSAQHLGSSFLDVTARQTGTVRVAVHRTRVIAPGSGQALIAAALFDGSRGCVDVSNNELVSSAGVAGIALTVHSPAANLQVVLPAGASAAAVAADLGRANTAVATVDPAGAVTIVQMCK